MFIRTVLKKSGSFSGLFLGFLFVFKDTISFYTDFIYFEWYPSILHMWCHSIEQATSTLPDFNVRRGIRVFPVSHPLSFLVVSLIHTGLIRRLPSNTSLGRLELFRINAALGHPSFKLIKLSTVSNISLYIRIYMGINRDESWVSECEIVSRTLKRVISMP